MRDTQRRAQSSPCRVECYLRIASRCNSSRTIGVGASCHWSSSTANDLEPSSEDSQHTTSECLARLRIIRMAGFGLLAFQVLVSQSFIYHRLNSVRAPGRDTFDITHGADRNTRLR